ncbi:MAG TPA: hypothetical protein PLU87_17380 [Sedimentisphaerales bacterium]|nr:hypothetical protein [Sedimentisphaerales bacterium]HRS12723.1 hypothetical protein [Sedimentisphaerales bacterium]HRV49361.1 hypothetical protein [Sedimentisphaerales bacterium]
MKHARMGMAEAMGRAGEVRVVEIEQLTAGDWAGVDLVVVGSPTHAFNVPTTVRSALAKQPEGILAGKSVAAFDTTVRAWPFRRLRASPKLLRRLRRLGGTPVAKPETFFVRMHGAPAAGGTDLLEAGQIDRARQWATELLGASRT